MSLLIVRDLMIEVAGRVLFHDVSLEVGSGECVAVVGPSGVGKTSLLNCLGGITTPNGGSVVLDGVDLTPLSPAQRAEHRLRHVGLVFQFGELMPELTLVENVALPLRLLEVRRSEAEARARAQLDRLGLAEHHGKRPDEVSGGQVQRAGIARALVHEPDLVLADEPTGMLDEETSRATVQLLIEQAKSSGAGLVMVTHDSAVAARADKVLRIRDGAVTHETAGPAAPLGRS